MISETLPGHPFAIRATTRDKQRMTTQETIEEKISRGLKCSFLDLTNESHLHNVPDGSESHFRLVVVSDEFNNKNLVTRHRTINKLLAAELAGAVHALALHTFTNEEWNARGESAQTSPDCMGGSKR